MMRCVALFAVGLAVLLVSGIGAEPSHATPTACHDLFRVGQIAPLRLSAVGPDTVVVGRIDGDGRDDVAIAGSGGIRVFLANAGGQLDAVGSSPGGASMMSGLGGDLTGDGRVDLVGSNGGPVMVWAGDGQGHFALTAQTPAQNSFVQAVADLNADAKGDVVMTTVEPGGAFLRVLLGDGTGALRESAAFPVAADWFVPAVVGDLDGDGRPDVLLGGRAGATVLQMLPGDGSGGPRPAVAAQNGITSVGAMALADFNQDARMDVAVRRRARPLHRAAPHDPARRCRVQQS